ncbi:alpha/beta fold hydrolase [Amantichitinum ursilacus]|uniref:Non-heme chloroperoxidase n=1 Tax=Amantichitinum ursilacus TaxID=857265 RepID=A0A0N0XM27_9NEIS|nr:alpha/beta hydrolase [Amantichitinum ursilacus]KPC54257.1 Non-heme chloroperoxidase [Amantichitinum ursilacus]
MTQDLAPEQGMDRRTLLKTGAGAAGAALAAAAMAPAAALAAGTTSSSHVSHHGKHSMDFVTVKDGTNIYFKDWGTGQPVVFSHGWPLSSDAWEPQMLFLVQKGYRVIAHDRRGHGRSSQSANGNDMDTYADDLAAVIEALDLKGVTLVGHSTGGGEVAHYIGRHGNQRVAKAVLIGAVPPLMLKTPNNPEGTDISVFDGIRADVIGNRSQLFKDLAVPFFGFNRPNAKVSQGTIDEFWREGMAGSALGHYLCVKQFSEVDYTEDLKKIEVPTLVLHGDDDQIVPIDAAGKKSVKLLKHGTLKIIEGGAHGMCVTSADKINAELLAFLQA